MKDTLNKLQFEEIKNEVKKRAIGNHSKERIDEMTIKQLCKLFEPDKQKRKKHASS